MCSRGEVVRSGARVLSVKWTVLLGAVGLTACSRPPTDEECLDLVERYAGQLLRANNPDMSEADMMRLQRQARARAEEDPMLGRCRHKVSRRHFDCAMKASNPDETEKCLLP